MSNFVIVPGIISTNWQLSNFTYKNDGSYNTLVNIGAVQNAGFTASSITIFLSFDGVNYLSYLTIPSVPFVATANPKGGITSPLLQNLGGVVGIRLYGTNLSVWNLIVEEITIPIINTGF